MCAPTFYIHDITVTIYFSSIWFNLNSVYTENGVHANQQHDPQHDPMRSQWVMM